MRAEVQEAYGEWREAERRAAATARHYDGMVDPRGLGRPEQRMAESDAYAQELCAHWRTLSDAYQARRAQMLADAGADESLACQPTEEEEASRRRHEQQLLDYPPVGWGRSTPDYEVRCARWRARPADDRLRDPNLRDVRA
jgi:hypothetical protein